MPSNSPPAFISRQVESGRYFFGDLSAPGGAPIAVSCAGQEDCSIDYLISRDTFPYYALEFVQSGQWRLTVGADETILGPGAVFLYGPGFEYQLEAVEGDPLRKYFFNLVGSDAEHLLRKHGALIGKLYKGVDRPERIRQIFDQLVDCADLPLETARPLALHLAELLLMRVSVDSRVDTTIRSQGYQSFLRARYLISQHHTSLTKIEEAAKLCGLSPAYLSRLFNRFGGEGPLKFLTRLRMQHAADLLLRHSTNVQETAQALGFTDPFHFSRVFKRVHGLSPRAFLSSHGDSGWGRSGQKC